MKRILVYLLGLLFMTVIAAICSIACGVPAWDADAFLLVQCAVIGMVAGILYCLRAVYVNTGLDRWKSQWELWYFLRPITSGISGFASCVFLQAGLLALSSKPDPDAMPYGYLAVAFIAGYNVDFFMKKIETIAQELWGIDKSRASRDSSEEGTPKSEGEEVE